MDICKPSYVKFYLRESNGISTSDVHEILDGISIKLRDRWVESGHSDFSIYAEPSYIFDMADCYFKFSRGSITKTKSILPDLGSILDYYNGIGLTTIQIKNLWPDADIFYFNDVETQKDWMIEFSRRFREPMENIVEDRSKKYDAVFLFEVLEHMENPEKFFIEEINDHIKKYLIFTAPFGEMWMGHFPHYNGTDSRLYKRRFKKFLTEMGYQQIFKGFNERPLIYEKVNR